MSFYCFMQTCSQHWLIKTAWTECQPADHKLTLVPFRISGVVLQWDEACGSHGCPAWCGECLGSHKIGLRDASRYFRTILSPSTAAPHESPSPQLTEGSATDCKKMKVPPSLFPHVNELTWRVLRTQGKWRCPGKFLFFFFLFWSLAARTLNEFSFCCSCCCFSIIIFKSLWSIKDT